MSIDDAARDASKLATEEHRIQVRRLIKMVVTALEERAQHHDDSKLEQPELDLFAEWGPKLGEVEYGSHEYKRALEKMGVALKHHYEHNRHHPEYYLRGVDDMTIVDLVEMVCDWKASTLRLVNGSFVGSLEINRKRFNLSCQLVHILENTAVLFEGDGVEEEDKRMVMGSLPWGKVSG